MAEYEVRCGKCARFDEVKGICRNDGKQKRTGEVCADFQIRLADHYVPNMWDAWKNRKMSEPAGRKK